MATPKPVVTPPPPVPVSTWRVKRTTGDDLDIKAVWCLVNSGALVFKDGIGNLVRAFAPEFWVSVEMLPNPYEA